MAALPTESREKITRGALSYWSNLWEIVSLSMQDLQAAVNATDDWIDDNQASYNTALPQAARDNLTAVQKTLLFSAVAIMRHGGVALLSRIFGGLI